MFGVARRSGRLKLGLRLGAAIIQLTATNRQTTGQTDMASGTKIADISGVPAGVSPTLTPNDGRFVIAGDAGSGWKVVRGMTAISAGTIALTVAATGAASVSFSIDITQAAAVGPQPLTMPSMTDNGDGTYTVTPATWDSDVTVSNKTKRRDSQAVSGLSGNTITREAADATTFIDYAETGTRNGASTTVASYGFAIPASAVRVFSASKVGTGEKFTDMPANLQANSVGTAADKDKLNYTTPGAAEPTVAYYAFNGSPSAPGAPFYLLADAGAKTYTSAFRHAFNAYLPVFDYDAASGDHWRLEMGAGYTKINVYNGTTSLGPPNAASNINTGYNSYQDTPSKKVKVFLSPTQVFITSQNASGNQQTYALPRPVMRNGQTTKVGFVWGTGVVAGVQLWELDANVSPFTVDTIARTVDGKLRAKGSYTTQPTSLTYRVFDDRGKLIVPATVMNTISIANSAFEVESAAADGFNAALTSKTARIEIWDTADPSKVFPISYAVAGYSPPEPLVFGQNVARLTNVFRPMRTYSNMMQQGYWQKSTGDLASVYRSGADGYLDAKGWPLKPGLWYWYPLPDAEGVQATVVLEWDGGPMTIRHIHTAGGAGIGEIGAIQSPTANKKTWTMTANRASGTSHELCGRFEITALDTANPPKNIRLYHQGDDLTQRFRASFIDFMKLLPGRIRFMDDTFVNSENGDHYNTPWVWANRSIQDNGSQIPGAAYEDYIEICNRTNRPITLNLHGSFAFESGGLDYYDNLLDLITYGTGAQFITPGYSAPNGFSKMIDLEVGNESWNPGFGGNGHYHYYARTGVRLGLYPSYADGAAELAVSLGMRLRAQRILMARMQQRIPNWQTRFTRVMNLQMEASDFLNVTGHADAAASLVYDDKMLFAPYIPADANAGGQAANFSDKSPAGICAFLKSTVDTSIKAKIAGRRDAAAGISKGFGVYEVGVSMISLGLTIDQIKALCQSDDWYLLWKNTIIPMAVAVGGDWSLYSDVTHMFPGEMWGVFHIAGSTYNRAWDAIVEWQAAHMPA